MTDWKYSVYLVDLYDLFDEDEEDVRSVINVVRGIYTRLLLLKEKIVKNEKDPHSFLSGLSGLDFIIDDFHYFDETIANYNDIMEEFERIMADLYDFADYNFIWINTFDRDTDGIGKP
jgi:hypothetical protein